ncbi:unnamed protein product [Citrullus colocynthis]|uniref:Uncharacterized protein n=1 Tax=Citrullus colocynthis TaxID=252529 RepID=A0ABP0XY87_9ROSI
MVEQSQRELGYFCYQPQKSLSAMADYTEPLSLSLSLSLSLQLIKEEKNKWPYRLLSLINTPQIQYSIIFPSINLNLTSNYLPNQISLPFLLLLHRKFSLKLRRMPRHRSPDQNNRKGVRYSSPILQSSVACIVIERSFVIVKFSGHFEFFRNSSSANEPNTNFNTASYFAAGNLLTSLAGKTHLAGNYRNSGDL